MIHSDQIPIHQERAQISSKELLIIKLLLLLGIIIRCLMFFFWNPFSPDPHFEVIEYIYNHHSIPLTSQFPHAFHPPLYHVLAALFLSGGVKAVHLFSLLSSIGTLLVYYILLKRVDFMSPKVKIFIMMFLSLLPSVVENSSYISNDSLSFFVGALIFLQIYKYIYKPTWFNLVMLSVFLGLGLLTKGTFLAFVPVLFLLVFSVRYIFFSKRFIAALTVFTVIAFVLGGYKFVENTIQLGRPIVHGLDNNPSWAEGQKPTYMGLKSLLDFNMIELVKHPIVADYSLNSIPRLFYRTFWYKFSLGMFRSKRAADKYNGLLPQLDGVGSLVHLIALLPTALIFIGFFRLANNSLALLLIKKLNPQEYKKNLFQTTGVLLFLMTFGLVAYCGLKYDVWSCFNSRLFFPSLFGIMICFNSGMSGFKKYKNIEGAVVALLSLLGFLFFLYYILETISGLIF